jgi:hypothetical protein
VYVPEAAVGEPEREKVEPLPPIPLVKVIVAVPDMPGPEIMSPEANKTGCPLVSAGIEVRVNVPLAIEPVADPVQSTFSFVHVL